MDLHHSIFQRKSCRAYDMQPLDQKFFAEIDAALQGFDLLYPDTPIKHRFAQKVKGLFKVEAPHYLIASGSGKPGELENAGFLLQQLMLWFDAHEIGSVWLGASKDADTRQTDHDIIVLAFGRSTGSIHRTKDQFKREPIEAITNSPDDKCIQATHLAPSGMNTQPWYLQKQQEGTLVYKKKLKPPISLAYKLSDIDMGIGLCHYALACKHTSKTFHFSRNTTLPEKTGYTPFGTIA